jgi:hypothetical protein
MRGGDARVTISATVPDPIFRDNAVVINHVYVNDVHAMLFCMHARGSCAHSPTIVNSFLTDNTHLYICVCMHRKRTRHVDVRCVAGRNGNLASFDQISFVCIFMQHTF